MLIVISNKIAQKYILKKWQGSKNGILKHISQKKKAIMQV